MAFHPAKLAREFDEGGASRGFGFAAGTIFAAFL
jgi:hypothetical protein